MGYDFGEAHYREIIEPRNQLDSGRCHEWSTGPNQADPGKTRTKGAGHIGTVSVAGRLPCEEKNGGWFHVSRLTPVRSEP